MTPNGKPRCHAEMRAQVRYGSCTICIDHTLPSHYPLTIPAP